MIGQRERGEVALLRETNDLPRGEGAIGGGGVRVEVNVRHRIVELVHHEVTKGTKRLS